MGAVGWTIGGRTYTYEEAHEIARQTGFFEGYPPAALSALQRTRTDGHWLSPSSAGGCARQRVLMATNDFYQDLTGEWASGVGTAVHGWLQAATPDGYATEVHLSTGLLVPLRDGRVVPFSLQGTLDCYDATEHRAWDYKTVTDFQYWHNGRKEWVDRDLPSEPHIMQANLYTYLLRHNGFTVDEYWIWYVRLHKSGERKPFLIPLWDDQDTEQLACELAEPLAWYEQTGVLPQNKYNSREYICRVCPLQKRCRELAKEGL